MIDLIPRTKHGVYLLWNIYIFVKSLLILKYEHAAWLPYVETRSNKVTYTRRPIYIYRCLIWPQEKKMLDGYRDVAKVFPCMHAWLSWTATRHARATVLCWCREKGKRGVTSPPLIETDSIRCMRQPVPCTTPRLRRGRARGCPPPRSMRRPIHYLLICCWCLVVVRTRASTHCSRAVCYCATLLVGACCFFFLYCWCCIYYHQNAWISSRNTSRSFRCVWLGQPPCPRASPLVHPILTND